MADQNRGRTNLPMPAPPRVSAASPAPDDGNQAQNGQRPGTGSARSPGALMLRNWRVRWRVLALVIVPTIAAIVLGGIRVEAARSTAASFARINQVATLGRDFTALTESVEDERDLRPAFSPASRLARRRRRPPCSASFTSSMA